MILCFQTEVDFAVTSYEKSDKMEECLMKLHLVPTKVIRKIKKGVYTLENEL